MRKWGILVTVIIFATAFAGCLGGEADEDGSEEATLVQRKGTIQPISGWAESDWSSSDTEPFIAEVQVQINLNHTNLVKVKFSISVEDSDAQHQETDQGSDPDTVYVTAVGGNVTSEEQTGVTPATINIEVQAERTGEEMNYMGSTWNLNMMGECYGGKPRFVFGFIVYKDQGFSYTISGEYTYMAEEVSM